MGVLDYIKDTQSDSNKASGNVPAGSPNINQISKDFTSPSSILGEQISKHSYGLTHLNSRVNKYDEYGVHVNPINSEEELNIERAKNQSGFEQLGHSLAQIVENEILLGSAKAVSDIVDWVINIGNEEPNDFTNEVSSFLENLQEKNKERLAIYQENPNESWQIGDFGWWANNLVSVGSTAALMVPSLGISKGLNWISKALKINKGFYNVAKGISNIGGRVQKGKRLLFRPTTFTQNVGNFVETGAAAFASRISEGYMEARDTYNTVYEKALHELQEMSDEDKTDLIERNPKYAEMTDNEIAKDLASISGTNTFNEDLPLVMIDFLQYKSINNLFKNNIKNAKPNARVRLEHRNSMKKLAGEEAKEITTLNVLKESLAYNIKNPQEILKSIPFNEGFEEGYQGIVQSRSEELYKMALDPKVSARSLSSYLTDGHIWEQAFWGIVGGAIFEGVGSGIASIKSEVERVKQNERLSKQNQKQKLTNERAKRSDIESRFNKMDEFIKNMEALNNGHHYSELETDKNGKPIIEDGESKYRELSESEVFFEKEKLINDFVDKMVMESIDNGTYDLLEEFITNEYFDKYFAANGMRQDDIDLYIKDRVQNRLQSTKDKYLKNLDILTTIIDNPYYYSLQLAAKDLTKREISIEAYDDVIANIDEKLQNMDETKWLSDTSYDRELISVIKHNLEILNNKETELRKDYVDKKISRAALDEALKEINKSRNKFYQTLDSIKSDVETYNDIKNKLKSLKKEQDLNIANSEYNQAFNDLYNLLYSEDFVLLTDTTRDLLKKRAINDIKKQLDIINLPVGEEAIKEIYGDLDYSLTQYMVDRLTKSFKLVEDYVTNHENPVQAFEQLMASDENLSKELRDALDILKLSSKNNSEYYKGLIQARDKALAKLQQEAVEAQRVFVNNEEVSEETREETRAEVENVIEEMEELDSSSTGEQEDAFATEFIDQAGEAYQEELNAQSQVYDVPDDYFSGNTYGLDLIFNDFITKHKNSKQYIEIIKNIKQVSFEDANYKKIFETLVDELVLDHGVDERTANTIAKEQIGSIFGLLSARSSTNPSLKQKYLILARQLKYGVEFTGEGERLSATSIIEDEEAKFKIIDEIIKLYKEDTNSTSSILDVDKFFEHMMANEEIDFNTAAVIFNYFTDYLLNRRINTTNSYVFDNFYNNASDFFNKLREIKSQRESITDYMHIRASRRKAANYDMAIAAAKRGEKVYLRQQPDHTENIQVMCMGVEIGVITKTKATNDKNTRFKKTINTSGLWWEVEKTEDGYVSNYDEFFNALFDENNKDAKTLLFLLRSRDALNDIDYLKAAIEDVAGGNLIVEEINRQQRKGRTTIPGIIREILNIVDYSRETDSYYSYQGWLEKVYDNYAQTKRIGDILKANEENTVVVDFKNIGVQTPYYVDENVEVGTQPFVEELNPVIAVDKNGQIITEKGSHQFNSATIFSTGTMGFLLHNANGNPIITRFAEANGVTKGSELYKALYNYLTNIFNEYQSNESYTINNLYEDLLELLVLRKDKNDTEFNPLFSGYTLVKINGGIAVAKALPYGVKEGKTPFVLAIYDKKYTKKGYDGEAGQTRSYTLFNEEGKPYANIIDGNRVSFSTPNPMYIHAMVEDIISGLRFNRSMTFITNRNEKNVKTNKHFYKENGKLYVELGDKKIEYDSYFQFIMKNNAFKVNVQNKNGSFTYNSSESQDFYISIDKIEPGKTQYELLNPNGNVDSALEIIETASTTTPVSVLSVLETIGADVTKYKPWIDNGLFTDSLYYNSDPNAQGHASTKNGKITFTRKGLDLLRKHPEEITRLLAHEEFHIRLQQANVFEREALINDLLDTYNQFAKAVEERAANGDREAIVLKNWIEKNNFKPDGQFIKDDVNNREFVEEWLVESITNQPIIQFLNSVQYDGAVKTSEKKSILQRIIEVILNLFGIDLDTINKSSILAKQISLFNEETLNTPTNITTNENGETNINSPVEGENIQDTSEIEDELHDKALDELEQELENEDEEELFDYEEDEFDDMMSATIPFIELSENADYVEEALNNYSDNTNNNPHGFIMVTDMEKFIESYPLNIRSKIRKMIDEGTIKFICR